MSTLLTPRTAAFLDLALPGTLVVLDFDGTLARIVRDRDEARLSDRSREVDRLLRDLASLREPAPRRRRGSR